MRAYYFCNFYLSSIQQGIQASHCTAEMFVKYSKPSVAKTKLYNWAKKDKVMIVLNGGNCANLQSIYDSLTSIAKRTSIPLAKFSEDTTSLNNALTCVGIVVEPKIYEFNAAYNQFDNLSSAPAVLKELTQQFQMGPDDIILASIIRQRRLAA